MTVFQMDIVCDHDTAGTVRGYFARQKQPVKGMLPGRGIAGKKM